MSNMATASITASLACRCVFLSAVVFLRYFHLVSGYAPEVQVTCRSIVDVRTSNYDAGVIVSQLPERIPIYANEDERCDIHISIPTGHEMMFYFDWLDLYSGDLIRCDTASIELFDGSSNQPVKGLNKRICGQEEEMPTNVYFVENNFLVIRVNALGTIQGTGFRIHFTISRRSFPCSNEEFACETFGSRRCIAEHLVCDDWNDCGDWVDEEQNCNNITAGGIAAIVIASIALIALILGLIVFCKIRKQRQMRQMGEKDTAIMRDVSATSSRGGLSSPFSVSSETMEKEKYVARYNSGRNSGRRSQTRSPEYEERPPPYTEKPHFGHDDSRSDDGLYEDQELPRSRRKSRSRETAPDEVFVEDDAPRMRRSRSRSQDERAPSRADEDRYPSRRDDRDSPRDDRYPRDRDDRYPPRDDRYPSRRDDRDSPRSDRYSRNKDDRYPSRRDDRDRDSDSRYSREDDRDRDRYPSRRDDRDRDRDRDRDSGYRRDRPRSRRAEPEDRYSSGREDLDIPDQLHPLREEKRRSMHSESEHDTSKEDRRTPQRDRSRDDDDRYPPPDDRQDRYNHRPRDREDPRDDRGDDRYSPRDREDRPRRDERSPAARDDRPVSRGDRGLDRHRESPASRRHKPPSNPDDSYESGGQDAPPRGRRHRPESRETPSAPAPEENPDIEADEPPPRRRRRRSRSRDGHERPRSTRNGEEGREEEDGRRGRGSVPPVVPMDEEPRRPRHSHGGYREESV